MSLQVNEIARKLNLMKETYTRMTHEIINVLTYEIVNCRKYELNPMLIDCFFSNQSLTILIKR